MENRPLRHEDYLAMEEENRRLIIENKKLVGKKQSPKVQASSKILKLVGDFFKEWGALLALVCIAAAGIGFIIYANVGFSRDRNEQKGDISCYVGVARAEGSHPWDTWSIWSVRRGRDVYWKQKINQDFKTWEEGDKFFNAWKLKYCSNVYGENWQNQLPVRMMYDE